MPKNEKYFLDQFSKIIALIVSFAGFLSPLFYGQIAGKTPWWIYATGVAIIGLAWLGWFLFRKYKRKSYFRRIILQRSDESTPIGFNGGLPYVQADRDRFFGRENDINALTAQIKQDEYGFGVLFGESGVGKTSLLRAGIIPVLEPDYKCIYVSFNNLPRFYEREGSRDSGQNPLSFIISRSGRELGLSDPVSSFEEMVDKTAAKKGEGLVLFLDQFEQLFDRVPEQKRSRFAETLQEHGSNRNLPLKFIVSVRADYFSHIYKLFDIDKRFIYSLERFNEAQAREIIRCSCGLAKDIAEQEPEHPILEFEDGIIADLRDGDGWIHPVEVSLICWTMMKTEGKLTRTQYLEGGRKQGWLDRYLDDVLQYLSNREQQALRVLSTLISGDISAALSLSEITGRSGIPKSQTKELLDYFEQSKIIIKEWSES